jgi:hypothetical protein
MEAKSASAAKVPVHLDEETRLHYIIGRQTVLFENGVKIDRASFEARIKAKRTIAQLIEEAKKYPENCGWDFRGALHTTELARMKEANKTPETPDIGKQVAKSPVRARLAEKKTFELGEIRFRAGSFFSAPYTDIIIMVLFVGLLCMAMSIYHTDMFLIETGKSPVVAIIGAVAMVTFSASAYTAARHVFQDHGIALLSRLFFSSFLVITGTATILFSVFSTVNVSYEQFRSVQKVATQAEIAVDPSVSTNAELLADKNKQLADADVEVAEYQKDRDSFLRTMNKPLPEGLDSQDPVYVMAVNEKVAASRNYSRSQVKLEQARAARDKLYADKDALEKGHLSAVDTASHPETTAYRMVSAKFGIVERDIEFIVYTVPAVFFDIVAPFAIAIVLLLKDRRKGIEKLSFFDRLGRSLQEKLLGRIK